MKKLIMSLLFSIIAFCAFSICVYGATSDSVNDLFTMEVDQALMGKEI